MPILDFVQLQYDVTAALANRTELQRVNVMCYRKLRLQSEMNLALLVTQARDQQSGRNGAGILVEAPEIKVRHPNLPGPEMYLLLKCVVLEVPALNLVPQGGTLLSAEEICQWILDTLHGFRPFGNKGFTIAATDSAISKASDLEGPGVLAYRVTFEMRMTRTQSVKCDMPKLTADGLTIYLSNGTNTPDADIWYSLDGTFPGQFPAPLSATFKFVSPFQVVPGQKVRWAAYKQDYCFSEIGHYQA